MNAFSSDIPELKAPVTASIAAHRSQCVTAATLVSLTGIADQLADAGYKTRLCGNHTRSKDGYDTWCVWPARPRLLA